MSLFNPLYLLVLQTFVFAISILTALFEIQIEGPHGWAVALPTWKWESKWIRSVLNGKNLTGYHLYLNVLLCTIFHFPLLIAGWSWQLEATILCCFFEYLALWDFLWFILNPFFGWKRFMKNKIWWFRKRIGPFPIDYYYGMFLSAIFAMLRGIDGPPEPWMGAIPGPLQQLIVWTIGIGITFLCVFILVCFHQHPENVDLPEDLLAEKSEKFDA